LILSDIELGDTQFVETLSRILISLKSLISLNLTNNQLSDKGIESIANTVI